MVKKSNSQSMALHLFDTMLKVFEKNFLKLLFRHKSKVKRLFTVFLFCLQKFCFCYLAHFSIINTCKDCWEQTLSLNL